MIDIVSRATVLAYTRDAVARRCPRDVREGSAWVYAFGSQRLSEDARAKAAERYVVRLLRAAGEDPAPYLWRS